MTFQDFQDYYENQHAPLCVKYASGMKRYVRRYLTPQPNPATGTTEQLSFDDEAVFRGTVAYLATSKMPDDVVEDEKRLFDRTKMRIATVVERESALAK